MLVESTPDQHCLQPAVVEVASTPRDPPVQINEIVHRLPWPRRRPDHLGTPVRQRPPEPHASLPRDLQLQMPAIGEYRVELVPPLLVRATVPGVARQSTGSGPSPGPGAADGSDDADG